MNASDPTSAVPLAAVTVDPALLPATVETLRHLVGFDTTSSGSNRELIDWVANRLDDLGIRPLVQHGDEPGKANLFATIGPDDRPGVMLSGHSDVVPVAGEVWQSDPFTLTDRDTRLYGRGSADMKAYIACCLAMAPAFRQAGLSTPVQHMALNLGAPGDRRDAHGKLWLGWPRPLSRRRAALRGSSTGRCPRTTPRDAVPTSPWPGRTS